MTDKSVKEACINRLHSLLCGEELQKALIFETERAIKQRDLYLETGVSTASHGGSHDTCFGAIMRQHAEPISAAINNFIDDVVKEAAYDAYYAASDRNRCDRWSDTYDDDTRAEFEKYWSNK